MVTLRAKINLGDDCFELRHGFIACQSRNCGEKGCKQVPGKAGKGVHDHVNFTQLCREGLYFGGNFL